MAEAIVTWSDGSGQILPGTPGKTEDWKWEAAPAPPTPLQERAEGDKDGGGPIAEGLGGCSVGNMKGLDRGALSMQGAQVRGRIRRAAGHHGPIHPTSALLLLQ